MCMPPPPPFYKFGQQRPTLRRNIESRYTVLPGIPIMPPGRLYAALVQFAVKETGLTSDEILTKLAAGTMTVEIGEKTAAVETDKAKWVIEVHKRPDGGFTFGEINRTSCASHTSSLGERSLII